MMQPFLTLLQQVEDSRKHQDLFRLKNMQVGA